MGYWHKAKDFHYIVVKPYVSYSIFYNAWFYPSTHNQKYIRNVLMLRFLLPMRAVRAHTLFLPAVFFLSPIMIKYHFLHEFFPSLLTALVIPSFLLGDPCSD